MFNSVVTNVNSTLHSPSSNTRWEYILRIQSAILILLAVMFFYTYQYIVHHDLAGGLLSGKLAFKLGDEHDLYSIYFPPAERVWFTFAAKINDITGWRLDLVVVGMTYFTALFSAEFAYQIRKKTVGATPTFFIVSLTVLILAPILFKNVFGLREHLVALGIWPYLVYRLSDPSGTKISTSWRVILGFWVGWALLFKYFYAIVILLIELADALIHRRISTLFRIENMIAGTIVTLYLLFWLVLNMENYNAILQVKGALSANLIGLKANVLHTISKLTFAAPLLIAAWYYKASNRNLILVTSLLVAVLAVAALQARWYSHHHFPILLVNTVLLWLIARNAPKLITISIGVFLIISLNYEIQNSIFNQSRIKVLEKEFQENHIDLKNKRVAILVAHPSPFNQIIAKQGGLRWNAVVNIAHVAAELEPYDTAENNGRSTPAISFSNEGGKIMHEKMLDLWEDFPPDVIIMDQSTSWPLQHLKIKWMEVFANDNRFLNIVKNYQLSHSYNENHLSYDYYVRKKQ